MSEQNQQPPKDQQPPKKGGIKVRVLVDGPHGKANDVVELASDDLKAAKAAGTVDDDPAAVKFALSLAKPKD